MAILFGEFLEVLGFKCNLHGLEGFLAIFQGHQLSQSHSTQLDLSLQSVTIYSNLKIILTIPRLLIRSVTIHYNLGL